MSTPSVSGLASVIIPCWNQLKFTRKCIAALFRHDWAGLGVDRCQQWVDGW